MLGAIQFGQGLASGLDFRAIVDAIIEAERFPVRRLQDRIEGFNKARSSINELSDLLGTFESALKDLKSNSVVGNRTVAYGTETTAFTATAGSSAATGTYSVEIQQIAQAQRVRSNGLADRFSPLVNDGTITIKSGSNDEITIDVSAANGNNSLRAVADAINNEDQGVIASIINDGTNDILVVRSEKTGSDNALTITDTTNLGLADTGNELQAAQNAQLIVDGVAITSQTNTVSSAVQGVTLKLAGTTDAAVEVTIEEDVEGAKQALRDFVEDYNEIADFFDRQFGSATIREASAIAGSSIIRNMQNTLQRLVIGSVTGVPEGSVDSLAQLGVQIADRTGRLEFKESAFDDIIEQGRFDEVRAVLQSSGSASDPAVVFLGSTTRTEVGTYDVVVNSIASAAQVAGSVAVRAQGIAQSETLTVTLNGDMVDVLLASGDTITDIVGKVNTALDGAGIAATASDQGGILSIASDEQGSNQSLTVVSDRPAPPNGRSSGIGNQPLSSTGTDLDATIGGYQADAVGNEIIGADGTPVDGLRLRVYATTESIAAKGGDFGQVGVSKGVVDLFLEQIDRITDPFEGTLKTITDGFDASIESLEDRVDRIEERLIAREELLIRRFSFAEQAIASLQQMLSSIQGSF